MNTEKWTWSGGGKVSMHPYVETSDFCLITIPYRSENPWRNEQCLPESQSPLSVRQTQTAEKSTLIHFNGLLSVWVERTPWPLSLQAEDEVPPVTKVLNTRRLRDQKEEFGQQVTQGGSASWHRKRKSRGEDTCVCVCVCVKTNPPITAVYFLFILYVFWGSGERGPGVLVPSRLCTGTENWVELSTDGNCGDMQKNTSTKTDNFRWRKGVVKKKIQFLLCGQTGRTWLLLFLLL